MLQWSPGATRCCLELESVGDMDINPVRTEADYEDAVRFIDANWGVAIGTEAGDRLGILMTLVDAYERERWPIDPHET